MSNDLLKILDEYEIDIFTEEDFLSRTGMTLRDWINPLRTLIKNGIIEIIEKGKYCRHNFRNEYVIGCYLASKEGAIAYWSALNLHGLTEQISNTVFVQMTKVKQDKEVFHIPYQFIKVKKEKFIGIEKTGYGNHSYLITDKEKTIVDCFDLPQYAGEFPGLIKAFVSNEWREEKLIEYAKSVNNQAAIKRMGFIAQSFELPLNEFIEFAQSKVTRTISLLDNTLPDEGRVITNWGLRLNLSLEDLLQLRYY